MTSTEAQARRAREHAKHAKHASTPGTWARQARKAHKAHEHASRHLGDSKLFSSEASFIIENSAVFNLILIKFYKDHSAVRLK